MALAVVATLENAEVFLVHVAIVVKVSSLPGRRAIGLRKNALDAPNKGGKPKRGRRNGGVALYNS